MGCDPGGLCVLGLSQDPTQIPLARPTTMIPLFVYQIHSSHPMYHFATGSIPILTPNSSDKMTDLNLENAT